jgi:hypothetical protein
MVIACFCEACGDRLLSTQMMSTWREVGPHQWTRYTSACCLAPIKVWWLPETSQQAATELQPQQLKLPGMEKVQ